MDNKAMTNNSELDDKLLKAAESGDSDAAQAALNAGANPAARPPGAPNAAGFWGARKTALILAAEHGHIAIVRLLLDRGAPVDTRDGFRYDALRHAAFNGHYDVVRLLLERGASAGRDKALDTAAYRGYTEIVRLLLDHGANPNIHFNADGDAAKRGDTALLTAAREGRIETVALLLERGADPNACDYNNGGMLVRAVRGNGRAELVRFLLARGIGANPDELTAAMGSSILYNDPEVLHILLNAGASLAGKHGVRLVIDSAYLGQPASLRFLLDHGVVLTPTQAVEALKRACEQDRDFATRSPECLALLQERVLAPLLARSRTSRRIIEAIYRIAKRERLDDLARMAQAAMADEVPTSTPPHSD